MNPKALGLDKNLRSLSALSNTQPKPQDPIAFEYSVGRAQVKNVQLASDAVGTSNLADNSVTQTKIAGSVVQGTHIASSAVDSRILANNSVGSVEIGGSVVHGTHIGDFSFGAGTGGPINTNVGTFTGTVRADTAFSFNGTNGITGSVAVNQGAGTVFILYRGGLVVGTA